MVLEFQSEKTWNNVLKNVKITKLKNLQAVDGILLDKKDANSVKYSFNGKVSTALAAIANYDVDLEVGQERKNIN